MRKIEYKPIGIIHSLFKEPQGTPIQPASAKGVEGSVELFSQYAEGLKDLEGFSHLHLIYHFHLVSDYSLTVRPFMDEQQRGLFATRAPTRPNPIGFSIVSLIGIEEGILHVQDVDILDGTPLLDIKPYVPQMDIREADKIGWMENKVDELSELRDDGRFVD